MNSRVAKILALGLLALVVPATIQAQTSRVEGMSIQGDYIKDYTGIFQYTSQVANVGNLVYGELGVSSGGTPVDRSVGAVMGDWFEGRMGTWAVHMRQFTPQLAQGDSSSQPAPGDYGFDPNVNTHEQFDVMWGRKFGTASLGLRLNRSFGQIEIDNLPILFSNLEFDFTQADPNLARNILGLGVGFGWEMSPSTNVEANLFWQSRTFEIADSTGATLAEEDGKTTYQLAARAWWQWQPNVMVVPVFKWYSYDLSTAGTGTIVPVADNSLRGWQAGLAGNWTVGANDLFVLGLTFAQNKVEQEADIFGVGFANGTITETFTPQVFAALESHVNSWLTLRFGANKGAWYSLDLEDEATPAELTTRGSPFKMAIGAGVKLGGVQLDAIVNDVFPHNGLNFISGNTTTPVFPKVSATYAF